MASLYPSLDEYMGLDLRSNEVQQNLAVIPRAAYQAPALVESRPSQLTGLYKIIFRFVFALFHGMFSFSTCSQSCKELLSLCIIS